MDFIDYPLQRQGDFDKPKPIIPIRILNGHKKDLGIQTWGLIDTGADAIVIPKDMADAIGHNYDLGKKCSLRTACQHVEGYEHSFTIIFYRVDLNGNLKNETVRIIKKVKVAVLKDLKHVLLGVRGFLCDYRLEINYLSGQFSLRSK